MKKTLRYIFLFLMFRINWKNLFPIGAIITIMFLQLHTLPYQLTTRSSYLPDTNSFHNNLNSQITPSIKDEQSEAIKIDPVNIPYNSSSHSVQPNAVVQEKVKVNQSRNPMDIITTNISVRPSKPSSLSASERRRRRYLRDIKKLSPYEALLYARKEVDTVSVGIDYHDPDLYGPLFRNVSLFERSYELMELILKVYIYQEGKRPIFHTPYLRGIYSSEGWFMKFMESSRQFVTQDPEKAHLFYLPYSARQLQRTLYVPESHNLRPLSLFLRDYVNKLASKYPFWNKTHGSDHFLVACHDWGPYTLKAHGELANNTIKALCNADTSEGVFVARKDVSLPETTIGNPRRPLRNMGGKRISKRPILAFFAGGMHGRVRPTLIKHWANKDPEMIISGPMSYKRSQTMSYSLHMKSSRYCIRPMGAEKDITKLKEILLAIPMKRYRTITSTKTIF